MLVTRVRLPACASFHPFPDFSEMCLRAAIANAGEISGMSLLLAKWATPAIAQLVEHLTVDHCSNQMVPGSIPGGRTFEDAHNESDRRPCAPHAFPAFFDLKTNSLFGSLSSVVRAMVLWAIGRGFEPHREYVFELRHVFPHIQFGL